MIVVAAEAVTVVEVEIAEAVARETDLVADRVGAGLPAEVAVATAVVVTGAAATAEVAETLKEIARNHCPQAFQRRSNLHSPQSRGSFDTSSKRSGLSRFRTSRR